MNGPFASDSSFAVICLLLTVFLALAPQFLAVRMDAPARLFHILALSAAVTGSLLPLYRVMILALLACLLIIRMGKPASAQQAAGARPGLRSIASGLRSRFTKRAFSASRLFAAMVLLSMLAAVWLAIFGLSSPSRRLASPRNAYGRIATWEAAVGISLDHPASGVGLANYTSYFERKFSQSGSPIQSVNESRAAAYPHSNPLWIAAELGVPGFVLYITANVYMFLLGFRALKRATDAAGRLTAACYLTLMAGYWVPGLTLTSGAYSDLNLYYFFLLGLLSRK